MNHTPAEPTVTAEAANDTAMEREPLFPDTEVELVAIPENTADIANKMSALYAIECDDERLREQAAEAARFYGKKLDQNEKRREFLLQQIGNYLNQRGETKVQTHKGTAFLVNKTKVTWPEEALLLAWLKQIGRPDLISTVEKVSVSKVAGYIKETGSLPPGYEETTETRLQIRRAL